VSNAVDKRGANFPNGLNNSERGSIFSGLPIGCNPADYIVYHNDFTDFDVNQWKVRKVEAGGASSTAAIKNVRGGALELTTDNANGDLIALSLKGDAGGTTGINSFEFRPDKYLAVQAKFRIEGTGATLKNTKVWIGLADSTNFDTMAADAGGSVNDSFGFFCWSAINTAFLGTFFMHICQNTTVPFMTVGNGGESPTTDIDVNKDISLHLSYRENRGLRSAGDRMGGATKSVSGFWRSAYPDLLNLRAPFLSGYHNDISGQIKGPGKNNWYVTSVDQAAGQPRPTANVPQGLMTPCIFLGNVANAGNQTKLIIDSFTVIQER
tara:strand:- start:6795 stop:7763 length:969 start_codon:yes stop_codon:yes gene_type:complete